MPPENRQSPTPSAGNEEGTDLRSVAGQIETMLDDDGHFNPSGQPSRAHPDYDESTDERVNTPERDESGRFKSAKQPDETPEPEQAVEPDLEAESDVVDEDTPEIEGDTDEQLADSAVEDAQEQEPEATDNIRTVAELAEALEMSREEFLESITDTFGAAGDEVTVTLSEQLQGYQKDADYRRGTQQLSEAKQQAEQLYHSKMAEFEQHHRLLATHLNATEHLIAGKLEDPAMLLLRQQDPTEWTARNAEIARDLEQVRNARANAAQQYNIHVHTNKQQLKEREQGYLLERMPDFTSANQTQSRDVMKSIGYGDEEIGEIFDHRLVLAALEMHNLRAENAILKGEKETAKDAVKRVKKTIPKLTKPGRQRQPNPQGIKRTNLAKLQQRASKSGSVDDAAAVIYEMME